MVSIIPYPENTLDGIFFLQHPLNQISTVDPVTLQTGRLQDFCCTWYSFPLFFIWAKRNRESAQSPPPQNDEVSKSAETGASVCVCLCRKRGLLFLIAVESQRCSQTCQSASYRSETEGRKQKQVWPVGGCQDFRLTAQQTRTPAKNWQAESLVISFNSLQTAVCGRSGGKKKKNKNQKKKRKNPKETVFGLSCKCILPWFRLATPRDETFCRTVCNQERRVVVRMNLIVWSIRCTKNGSRLDQVDTDTAKHTHSYGLGSAKLSCTTGNRQAWQKTSRRCIPKPVAHVHCM